MCVSNLGTHQKRRSHIPIVLNLITPFFLLAFLPFLLPLCLTLRIQQQRKDNPVWSLRDHLFCMCPVFPFPDILKLQLGGISHSNQIWASSSSSKLPGICPHPPIPPDQQNRYKWSNLQPSRSIAVLFLFAFYALGSSGGIRKKLITMRRKLDRERLFTQTFCIFLNHENGTANSWEVNWSGHIWGTLGVEYTETWYHILRRI